VMDVDVDVDVDVVDLAVDGLWAVVVLGANAGS